jgi:hypothetical protein
MIHMVRKIAHYDSVAQLDCGRCFALAASPKLLYARFPLSLSESIIECNNKIIRHSAIHDKCL